MQLNRRALLSASAINGGGFLLASAVVLVWSYLVMRSFPGTASGQLLLAISVAGLINLLDMGVSLGLIKILSAPASVGPVPSARAYFSAALWVTLCVELVIGAAAVAIWSRQAPEMPGSAHASIVVFALSTQAILLSASALKGRLDFKAANMVSTGATLLVYSAGLVAIVLLKTSVWGVLTTMTVTQAACASVAVAFTLPRLPHRIDAGAPASGGQVIGTYSSLLSNSLSLFPQMFTGLFFAHAQRFIIARYAGLDAVAPISLAYSISTRVHSVMNASLEVLFPYTRQLLQGQGVRLASLCLRIGALSASIYLLVAAALSVVTLFLMPDITAPFIAFSVGVFFAIASAPAFHMLNGCGASASVSACSVAAPLVFLLLAPILHSFSTVGDRLLLPVAYAITMGLVLIPIAILVQRHSSTFAVHPPGTSSSNDISH